MPFTRDTFGPLAGVSSGRSGAGSGAGMRTNAPRLFKYATPDNNAAVIAANYFDDLVDALDANRNTLQVGDLIFATLEQGSASDDLRNRLADDTVTPVIYRVTVSSTTEITVVNGDTL